MSVLDRTSLSPSETPIEWSKICTLDIRASSDGGPVNKLEAPLREPINFENFRKPHWDSSYHGRYPMLHSLPGYNFAERGGSFAGQHQSLVCSHLWHSSLSTYEILQCFLLAAELHTCPACNFEDL